MHLKASLLVSLNRATLNQSTFMKTQEPVLQSIAGVTPPSTAEVVVMTGWPSVGCTGVGQFLGRMYRMQTGFGPVRIGRLALLMTMPLGLMLYLSMRLPWAICRFQVTNRRVTVNKGVHAAVERFVELNRFDTVELVVQPGQEWFDCGDLVFRNGAVETLRLKGVSRPEPFRRVCLEVRQSYVGVEEALQQTTGAA